MRFPIFTAIAEPAPRIECAPRDAGPAAARGGFEPTYSILIASGNAEERELLAALLSKAGYAVTAVENGELALKRFYAHKFDLVVANVVMPQIDGLELIQTLSSVIPAVAAARRVFPLLPEPEAKSRCAASLCRFPEGQSQGRRCAIGAPQIIPSPLEGEGGAPRNESCASGAPGKG
ncbi:MAG: response regulator [Alphaproteobacteria bacterium]|nr:response regulator [Alphaproteobacteria bacterium]